MLETLRGKKIGRRALRFLLILAGFFLPLQALGQSGGGITVSAAVSLKDAFEKIGKIYEQENPGATVVFNFGGSGNLAKQIEAGAPVNVFASADERDMDELDRRGLLATSSRRDFAENSVVLITPAKARIFINSPHDLLKAEMQKVAIGNPRTVPAGRYAQEVLQYWQLWPKIRDRLVFAENVRQVLDYVVRNEVDAGFVFATDAAVRSKEIMINLTAPNNIHSPIVYPIAVIRDRDIGLEARRFVQFIVSKEAQEILQGYGFLPAPSLKSKTKNRQQ